MRVHGHGFVASTDQASAQNPSGNLLAQATRPATSQEGADAKVEAPAPPPSQVQANFYSANPNNARTALAPNAIGAAGGNQPHNNMQPYLALNFCIALQGVMPQRA